MQYADEEWKVIEEFPRYLISNYGRIKSKVRKDECILQLNIIQNYAYVKLYIKDSERIRDKRLLRVHRLVAQYFCENFSPDKEVHHIDCDTLNNYYKNLICLTKEQHIKLHKDLKKGGIE